MKKVIAENGNPLSDLIPDNVYKLLRSQDFLDITAVRDYKIRREYKQLILKKLTPTKAMKIIANEHKLSFYTMKKIIYKDISNNNQRLAF